MKRVKRPLKAWLIDCIRIIQMRLHGKKIIMKNGGYIQFSDFTYFHRENWYDKYSIEQMEKMKKELKE